MFSVLFHGTLSLPMKVKTILNSFSALTVHSKSLAFAPLRWKVHSAWLCLGPASHQLHTSTGSLHCRAGTSLEFMLDKAVCSKLSVREWDLVFKKTFFPGLIEIKNKNKITEPALLQKPSSLFLQNTPFPIISISYLCALRKKSTFSENHVFALISAAGPQKACCRPAAEHTWNPHQNMYTSVCIIIETSPC